MPEDGSARPRRLRRLLVAMARAVALFILVTGIYGAIAVALPRWPVLNRSIAALLAGVTIFEMLRPARRTVSVPAPVQELPPVVIDNSAELAEARAAIETLRDALETARNRESEIRSEYERESENVQRAASRALEEIQRTRSAHDEVRGQLESERARALAARQELEKVRDTEQRLGSVMQELEALRAERQRIARDLEQTRQKSEVDKTKLADLQREVDLTHATSQKVVQANETLKKQFDDERQRLQAELQRVQLERDKMQSEARAVGTRENELIAQLDRERKLSQELAATRARLDEENAALKKRIDQIEAEWSAKLQKIVAELAADHENDLGEAIAQREEARAELRSIQQQVVKQHHERDTASQERERALKQLDDDWSAKLQKIVNGLTADHENDIGEAIAKREEARAETRALQMKIGKLEEQNEQLKEQLEAQVTVPMPALVDEKALREKIDAEWSAKLQTIVSHIASDHEADIGKAIEEREAARAEVRNLNIKMTALQQKLESERQAREALQTRYRDVEEQLRNAPTQPMRALTETFPVEEPQPQEEEQARANVLEFAEQAFEALQRATSPGTVPVPQVEEKTPHAPPGGDISPGRGQSGEAGPGEGKSRILIVHHDPRFRSMWADFLEKSGFGVQTAADGLEGLRVVKSEKPDAVIADVAMPKMDGRELCQAIKSNPETAVVKVILLSGMYTSDVPLAGEKSEFEPDELLRKPVKLEAMKTALSNLLAAAS